MNFFAVLLLSLFISVKSSNAAEDGTFDKNTMINMKSSTARAQDGTFDENAKTNGKVGLNVVLRNDAKQESQLTRFRRSVSYVLGIQDCYLHYFVGKETPTGFPRSSYRHICQGTCDIAGNVQKGCFSTLYDLTNKIPIYAAYVVREEEWAKIKSVSRKGLDFRKETPVTVFGSVDQVIKDIIQNIKSMYRNTGDLPCINKGHLVPAKTYSFSYLHIHSTFVYTNAVPQYQTFNSGEWSTFEKKIRNYGKDTCAEKHGGDLYLLTGISDHRIGKDHINGIYDIGITAPKKMPEDPEIVIPNSMWTAGCCVNDQQQVLGSFAVIGNNDWNKGNLLTSEVNVQKLEEIIGITLFPGNNGCSTHLNTFNVLK